MLPTLVALGTAALGAPVAGPAPLVHAPGLCATPHLLPLVLPAPDLPPAPPGGSKSEREALQGVAGSLASANFAVKWGAAGAVDAEAVADLLVALEEAWAVEVEEMGHPGPFGSDRYLVNVYVEDTGLVWSSGGTSFELRGSGASGYYYTDPEGHPMLVMSQGSLVEPDYAGMVAAHELYHAVQAALGSYPYSGRGAWFWEASATWISAEVFPEVPDYAVFLFGYALLPHLPVDFFDYPDEGALQEFHQYGAFIVLRYLSEHVADWTVVRDAWTLPDAGGDPLAALDAALSPWGTTVGDELVLLAAHNATWDYEDGEVYAANLETYAPYYGGGSQAVATLSGAGSVDWREVPSDSRPRAYGYNLVVLEDPDPGEHLVEVEVEASGSEGSAAAWQARVVLDGPDGPTYLALPLDEGRGALRLAVDGETRAVWLAAAVTSEQRDAEETFTWRYRLGLDGDGEDTGDTGGHGGDGPDSPEGAQACGCTGTGGLGGLVALWVLPLVARRRRPQRPPARARRRASLRRDRSPSSSLL